jgi:hypothetical protein
VEYCSGCSACLFPSLYLSLSFITDAFITEAAARARGALDFRGDFLCPTWR